MNSIWKRSRKTVLANYPGPITWNNILEDYRKAHCNLIGNLGEGSTSLRFHFDLISTSLRCHFDLTSASLRFKVNFFPMSRCVHVRFHFDTTLMPRQYHFVSTSTSLGCHSERTLISIRFHSDFASWSLWFLFDSTSIKCHRQLQVDFTSSPLRCHFNFTSSSRRIHYDFTLI